MMYAQQGDVILNRIESIPTGTAEVITHGILAYGEHTGHKHQVIEVAEGLSSSVQVLKILSDLYVVAKEQFTVRHEEHNPITLPPGTYKVGIVKEYDHFMEEARSVID